MTLGNGRIYFPPKVVSADVFMELITRIIDTVHKVPRIRSKEETDDVDELENDLETDDDLNDDEEEEILDEEEDEEDDDDSEL